MNLMPKKTLGRELDERLVQLAGEGAEMRVRRLEPGKGSTPLAVWDRVPSMPGAPREDYYRIPMLKEPVWIWSVPAYFYLGGVAGGSALLAACLHGKKKLARLSSACRWLSFLGTTVGPGFLTWDLGRRFRFLNMLRVFRPSSPMSVGSWSLAGSGALSTLALLQGGRPSGKPTAQALAGGGLMLSGYTGVLLGTSANPLWQESRRILPVLFTASAMASTAALLEMLELNRREEKVVRRFGMLGKVAEAASMLAMEQEAARDPQAGRALKEGRAGALWGGAKAFLAAGIVVGLLPGKSATKRRIGGTLTTIGAICLRFGLLESGKQAVRDQPMQRATQRGGPSVTQRGGARVAGRRAEESLS